MASQPGISLRETNQRQVGLSLCKTNIIYSRLALEDHITCYIKEKVSPHLGINSFHSNSHLLAAAAVRLLAADPILQKKCDHPFQGEVAYLIV